MSLIRKNLESQGHSEASIKIILASWRTGTNSQYQSYFNKWQKFCEQHKCDSISPLLTLAVDFLATLYDSGLSYSSVNTARSALSSLLQLSNVNVPFGQLPVVKRFMKGLYELRPSFPRYQSIWNVSTVLNYLREKPYGPQIGLKELTLRLNFLLCILSGQRCQTIHHLRIDHMEQTEDKCTFFIVDKVKQSRVGQHVKPLVFVAYPKETTLCVVTHIREYISRTASIRKCQQLLISYVKPNGPVSKDTISRWCKAVLEAAGVDISKFKGHSTRAASTSHLAERNFKIQDIISSAGWSNETVFQRFYNKPATSNFNLGKAILNSA